VLAELFGPQYVAYRRTVGAMLPCPGFLDCGSSWQDLDEAAAKDGRLGPKPTEEAANPINGDLAVGADRYSKSEPLLSDV
jgi:hypothetical protein